MVSLHYASLNYAIIDSNNNLWLVCYLTVFCTNGGLPFNCNCGSIVQWATECQIPTGCSPAPSSKSSARDTNSHSRSAHSSSVWGGWLAQPTTCPRPKSAAAAIEYQFKASHRNCHYRHIINSRSRHQVKRPRDGRNMLYVCWLQDSWDP